MVAKTEIKLRLAAVGLFAAIVWMSVMLPIAVYREMVKEETK